MAIKKNVYKVIRSKERTSCIMNRFEEFSIKYLKSFEVKTIPDTLGIFCFKRKRDAKSFIDYYLTNKYETYKIIRVCPIGKGLKPPSIASAESLRYIKNYYKRLHEEYNFLFSHTPPTGTVCYPSVLVLE